MKRIISIVGVLIIGVFCFFYDSDKSTAETLLEGTIENTLNGVVSTRYKEAVDWEGEKNGAQNHREETQCGMINYLKNVYGSIEYADINIDKPGYFREVYSEILKEFEYTISKLEKVDEGKYKTTITYKPFALGDALDETAYEFYDTLEEGELGEEIDNELFALLEDKAEEFAKDIKYSDEVSVDVTIKLYDDEWMLSDSYYDEFLAGVMDLNMDELEVLEEELDGLEENQEEDKEE